MNDTHTDPIVYAEGLRELRAATSTPEQRFEDRYKAERFAALAAEQAARAADGEPTFVTAEDLSRYRAPDGYAEGLKALREKEAR